MDYVQDCPVGQPYISTAHLRSIDRPMYYFTNIGGLKYNTYTGRVLYHTSDKNAKAKVMRCK